MIGEPINQFLMFTSAVTYYEMSMRATETFSPWFPHVYNEDLNNWPTHVTSDVLSEIQNEDHEHGLIQRQGVPCQETLDKQKKNKHLYFDANWMPQINLLKIIGKKNLLIKESISIRRDK